MHQDVGSNQMESGGAIKLSAEESPYGKELVAANCGPEARLVLLYFRYRVVHKGPGLNSLDGSNGRQRTFKKKSSMGNLGSLGDVHQESTGTLGLFSVSPLLPGHDMSDPVGSHMPAIT